MTMERFYVATTTGYLQTEVSGQRAGPGVTAMVLDRAYGHRAVVQFRSEDSRCGQSATRHAEAMRRVEVAHGALNAGRTADEALREAVPHGTVESAERFGCGCARCVRAVRNRDTR